MRAPQEILVAVDDSNNSQLMFDWVVTNAVQPGAAGAAPDAAMLLLPCRMTDAACCAPCCAGDRVHLLHVTLKDPDSSATGSNLPHSDYFEQVGEGRHPP